MVDLASRVSIVGPAEPSPGAEALPASRCTTPMATQAIPVANAGTRSAFVTLGLTFE